LGGEARIETEIFEKTFQNLFAENIRSKAAFEAHRENTAGELFTRGQKLLAAVVPVIEAVSETRSTLSDLEQASAGRPQILAFLHALRKTLSGLVPDHFVELYDAGRIDHLPRYVSALGFRARRGVENLEKDRAKEASVLPFADALTEMLESLSPSTTEAKRNAVEAFFWMLEEYKVSVFAQELGTAVPVSEKKMKKRLGEIRRMA
jgi:ATP-dependent helicase HrpA